MANNVKTYRQFASGEDFNVMKECLDKITNARTIPQRDRTFGQDWREGTLSDPVNFNRAQTLLWLLNREGYQLSKIEE